MKKTNYIGKYDYINYYTKQPSLWFLSHAEMIGMLKLSLHEMESDDSSDEEFDQDHEIDALEYYHQQVEEQAEIDRNDPKIIEGNILDAKSREYIKSLYPDFVVIDFEDSKYKYIKQEDIAIVTKNELLSHTNVICFQPVFIANNLITKPDAVVKLDETIRVYETKSTTTAKLHHYLDIFFQSKVLYQQEYLNDFSIEFNLCLTAYCYANKYEVPFITTDCINLKKSVTLKDVPFEYKQAIKLGLGYMEKNEFIEMPIGLDDICTGNYNDMDLFIESSKGNRKNAMQEKKILLEDSFNNFDNVIAKMTEHLNKLRAFTLAHANSSDFYMPIKPHANDKSQWKASDIFAELRAYYFKCGYDLFKYSGNVVNQKVDTMQRLSINPNIPTPFSKDMEELFSNPLPPVLIHISECQTLVKKLKSKCVYFDFETINTPFRPINNCLPYMQIITQCSIIKKHDDNTAYDKLVCNNILFDPKDIKIEDFKQLVDDLYEGNEYSYVVYNINFERSRLNELITYINEPEYTAKITTIIANLYDLAEFFDIRHKPYAFVIKELGGFYSIKKVLKYIEDHNPEIFKATNCFDYKKLEVSNGLVCQNQTMKRFHNVLSDQEWKDLSHHLKVYCENDVRAMIAVELLAKQLIAEHANN